MSISVRAVRALASENAAARKGPPGAKLNATYRGALLPQLQGKYVFGDLVNGRIFVVDVDALVQGSQAQVEELDPEPRLRQRLRHPCCAYGRDRLRGELPVCADYEDP